MKILGVILIIGGVALVITGIANDGFGSWLQCIGGGGLVAIGSCIMKASK